MFIPDGDDAVVATVLTQGPWRGDAQYGGTPAALLTWAVERVPTLVPMRIARLTVDLHRRVPLGRLGVTTEVVRDGKRLQIVVATITDDGGTEVARATALRLRTGVGPDDWNDPDLEPVAAPIFGDVRHQRERTGERNGFTAALDMREAEKGSRRARWCRTTHPVIAGEEPSPTVRLAWASDLAANIGNFLDHGRWSAINSDLTIGLARAPRGEWTGIDTRSWYADDGIGHSRADLFDRDGFVGTCTASLIVDEVAAPFTRRADQLRRTPPPS